MKAWTTMKLNGGHEMIIDMEDFPKLAGHNITAYTPDKITYAHGQFDFGRRGMAKRSVHRYLMGLNVGDPWSVDHIDHNGLNNRKCNLRLATVSQNGANSRKRAGTSSNYIGVRWHKLARKWDARIHHGKKEIYLGLYESEEQAARVRDIRAREIFGEFAKLNFPDQAAG